MQRSYEVMFIVRPDLVEEELEKLLTTIQGHATSGGATEALAGKNRMIVSATKSGFEGNDTVFYQYFLDGLQSAAAARPRR